MATRFVAGDLFATAGLPALAHGCNCAGAMGKGIAVEFKRRFPEMFAEYRSRCRSGRFSLGDVFTWDTGEIVVFNLGTQKTWQTKADLEAVQTALRRMVTEAESRKLRGVAMPRIGAGLGGLDWSIIRRELEELGVTTTLELIVVEEYEPGRVITRD